MLFTCYEGVQAARENDLENSLNISTQMSSENLFYTDGVILNWRNSTGEMRYGNRVCVLSCVLFHFDALSGCKVEMWRNCFLNTMGTFFNIHLKKI
jgi:hypothetical protein